MFKVFNLVEFGNFILFFYSINSYITIASAQSENNTTEQSLFRVLS